MADRRLKWSREQYLEYLKRTGKHISNPNGAAIAPVPAPDVERPPRSKPDAELPHKIFHPLGYCRMRVISHRRRLADADGVSAKAAIDGIVHIGLLANDTTKEIKEVSFEQFKVGQGPDEEGPESGE